MRRSPGFTTVALLTLALGIGLSGAMFTIVNGVLFRGLPFDASDRIVWLGTADSQGRTLGVSRFDVYEWQQRAHSLTGLSLFANATMTVGDDDRPADRCFGTYGSANMLALVGEPPILGRDFRAADDDPAADPVVILSYGLWTSRYDRDPSILGR